MISKENILIIIATIILTVTISIILPLFINSFQTDTNKNPEPFFILLFDLFCKIITTPILYIFYPLEDENFFVNSELHKKLLILGLICCIADLSSTYSGFTYRTPADLQIIISNFFFPLTIIINIILKVKYSHQEINSFLIIIIGLLVAILPLYSDFQLNNINIIWILVYFNSVFFGVISYIYQEYKLKINIVTIFF
jgi:drug/metabolite transporter (DMT)-like permease